MTECCKNCANFEPSSKQARTDKLIGTCHALPPVHRGGEGNGKLALFPTVVSDMWCYAYFTSKESVE